MHFSIPDTQEITDESSSPYTVFNLHINGVYHCSVRYRQLHSFHEQLKKEFPDVAPFPPKKLLSLTSSQLEERRILLEKYIQALSQHIQISNSETFNKFLLQAQQESQQQQPEPVSIDVYLMNGQKVSLNIQSTDQTDAILESAASQIGLGDDYVYYFGLFLIRKEDVGENSIVRKLQEFESPYISLKASNKSGTHRIVIRKSYWESVFDDDLIDDRVAMNLLYVQAVSDLERGWTLANKEQMRQLDSLQSKGSKKEYLQLARTLKYYGFLQFHPCVADYPLPGSRVIISVGDRELCLRVQDNKLGKEARFRVTRMRCWRITTTVPDDLDGPSGSVQPKLELSFEYLIAKETLKWVTIASDQAILMSMCLQGMVDEVMMKKQGRRMKRPQDRNKHERKMLPTFSKKSSAGSPSSPDPLEESLNKAKKLTEKVSLFGQRGIGIKSSNQEAAAGIIENDAFRDIGDDDL